MPFLVIAEPLSHSAISGQGLQVIAGPSSATAAQQGNQGTALVTRRLTSFPSYYSNAPSGKPSSCNTAYFRCAPRPVVNGRLRVRVFERHPFTRQAFIPMGTDKRKRAYVVIVAEDKGERPDLEKVKAFIVMGNMGIVYEANRWHSPMCALDETVEFAVVQNENGVPKEDCIEYHLKDDEELDIMLDQPKGKL